MYGAHQPQSRQLDITTAFGARQIFLHGSMVFIEIDGPMHIRTRFKESRQRLRG